eukprot:1161407-Pelagomonas_calceolata.AAC.9
MRVQQEELPPSPSAALNFDTRELEILFGLMEQNMAPLRRLTSQQAKEVGNRSCVSTSLPLS